MKNINIKQIAFTATVALALSACGGSSGGTTVIPVVSVPSCGDVSAVDMGKSVAIDVTGKTIKKAETDAEVRIWHFPDATKLACMISGKAIIAN